MFKDQGCSKGKSRLIQVMIIKAERTSRNTQNQLSSGKMQKYLLEKTIIGSLGRALHISISLPSHSHHQHQRSARSTSHNSPTLSKSSSNGQTHQQTTLHQQEIYPTLVSPQMAPCSSHVLESVERVLSISAAHKTTPCFHNTKPAIIQMESGWPSSVMTTTFFIV